MNKHLRVTSASRVSSQCVTLGSSLYYLVEIKSSGSQCHALG
ncbi:hypothetical protein [Wolbachia endosymbiont (group B) of Limnophora tigrina]